MLREFKVQNSGSSLDVMSCRSPNSSINSSFKNASSVFGWKVVVIEIVVTTFDLIFYYILVYLLFLWSTTNKH